jgi:predicted DNA-binding protein with PD1-like motif
MNISVTPGRKIIGRLAKGDDLLAALEHCAREHGITLGKVEAIGAVSQARVGYYNQAERKYYCLDLARPLEILSLIGNISLKDDKPMVHAHVTLSDHEGRAFGGHLAEGTLVFACEFILQEYQSATPLVRQMDDPTGLFLWPPE